MGRKARLLVSAAAGWVKVVVLLPGLAGGQNGSAQIAEGRVTDSQLGQLLEARCAACHAGENRVVAKFDVGDFPGLSPRYLSPGRLEDSRLWQRIESGEMPPPRAEPLTHLEKQNIKRWLENAPPEGPVAASAADPSKPDPSRTEPDTSSPSRPQPPPDGKQGPRDIVRTIEGDSRFKILERWAKQLEIDAGLRDAVSNYTIFAPTDEAIQKLGARNLAALTQDDGLLLDLLINHANLSGGLSLGNLLDAGAVTAQSAAEHKVRRDRNGVVWLGQSRIVESLDCSNGVVHVIDAVLVPPGVADRLPDPLVDAVVSIEPYVGEMVPLPAGRFLMGSPPHEPDRAPNEGPQHEVHLSPFKIGRYEITRGVYRQVMDADPSEPDLPGMEKTPREHPVQRVSWYDAVRFCNKLSALCDYPPYYRIEPDDGSKPAVSIIDPRGLGFRLLTEAEWEYACRAGQQGTFCFGDDASLLEEYGWTFKNAGPRGDRQPVGKKRANNYGLYDMHGNVYEWCWDYYAPSYDLAAAVDPRGPEAGGERVIRGGSWFWKAAYARSAARDKRVPEYRHSSIGFRVARNIPPENSDAGRGFRALLKRD